MIELRFKYGETVGDVEMASFVEQLNTDVMDISREGSEQVVRIRNVDIVPAVNYLTKQLIPIQQTVSIPFGEGIFDFDMLYNLEHNIAAAHLVRLILLKCSEE